MRRYIWPIIYVSIIMVGCFNLGKIYARFTYNQGYKECYYDAKPLIDKQSWLIEEQSIELKHQDSLICQYRIEILSYYKH